MVVWVLWGIGLSITTFSSAYVVKKYRDVGFAILVSFYTIYLGSVQIIATKMANFDLGFVTLTAPAGIFIYPFIAQVVDMINEVYGRKKAYLSIIIAFLTQVLLVSFTALAIYLPHPFWFKVGEIWNSLFSLTPRIILASWIAFLTCQFLDATVFSFLKERFEHQWWMRSVTSDIINLTIDSAIFITIAFYGVFPIVPLIIGQIITKNWLGIIDTPWFWAYRKILR